MRMRSVNVCESFGAKVITTIIGSQCKRLPHVSELNFTVTISGKTAHLAANHPPETYDN